MASGVSKADQKVDVNEEQGTKTASSKLKEKMAADEQSVNVTASFTSQKHPLQNRWEWYFFKPDKTKQWNECFKKIIDFDTVEDFWAVYNHIKPPSQVTAGCDYMIFKEGIKPMWEDKGNKNGGRWLLTLDKRERKEVTVDNIWMETLMCLVGEIFEDHSDDICGAVVQSRPKGDKVSIWTADCSNRDSFMNIGRMYKEKLHFALNGKFQIQYQSHEATSTKAGSMSKSISTL